ncbi:MAG: hypothetical protein H0U74_19565 [Bradymonadaceae bacterium]|nr:hypothetical protein [Lujinxingiaceae bacterium]
MSQVESERNKHAIMANRELVPFAMAMLAGDVVRGTGTGRHLPVGEPDALTLEAVEALVRMIPRGVLGQLVRLGGWRACATIVDGREQCLRLGNVRNRRNVELRYSTRSIEAVLIAFNASALQSLNERDFQRALAPQPMPRRLAGDVLVHHFFGDKVLAHHGLNPLVRLYFEDNALTRLCRLSGSHDALEAAVGWLLSGSLAPLLPWLGSYLSERWLGELDQMWQTHRRMRNVVTNWAKVFCVWRQVAVEHAQIHQLTALVELYQNLFADPHAEQRLRAQFQVLTDGHLFQTRHELRVLWADALDELLAIERVYLGLRGRHPVERTASEQLFMKEWEARQMGPVARRVDVFSRELRGVVG